MEEVQKLGKRVQIAVRGETITAREPTIGWYLIDLDEIVFRIISRIPLEGFLAIRGDGARDIKGVLSALLPVRDEALALIAGIVAKDRAWLVDLYPAEFLEVFFAVVEVLDLKGLTEALKKKLERLAAENPELFRSSPPSAESAPTELSDSAPPQQAS